MKHNQDVLVNQFVGACVEHVRTKAEPHCLKHEGNRIFAADLKMSFLPEIFPALKDIVIDWHGPSQRYIIDYRGYSMRYAAIGSFAARMTTIVRGLSALSPNDVLDLIRQRDEGNSHGG